QQTGDNKVANTISHAILGAVVAELQGNSAVVGGVGAAVSERGAEVIASILYPNKSIDELTQDEKQQVSALAQLATGLTIAALGGDAQDINTAIAGGKNAVENNAMSWGDGGGFGGDIVGLSPETGANYDGILHASAAGYLTPEETTQLIDDMNSGRFMYDPLREDLKRLPEDIAILTTPYGDYIAFRDAETWGDYAIAAVGALPFAKYIKVAGKIVKIETKAGQALVKEAEKAYHSGDIATGNQLMNQAASHGTTVETTVVRNSGAGKGMGGNSVANELTGITQKQLDKKFKHAADFGITTTKKNAETLSQYETAIKSHMGDKATKPLGTYGFVTDSKVFFNSNTNNVVVLDKSGNFVTGFKITPGTPQYENYMKNGVLR
ncbi:colicin D domain-containing protein, partial [Gilliamella sp. wkB292]|uniref:VENN motif pre-toxin domain-containing protein n=2 Tax=Gilliamella TaxID=1193503 RepID=UPI0009C127DF